MSESMAADKSGVLGNHTGDTAAEFVEMYVADWVKGGIWPPGRRWGI